jgi:hypothetical protein
MGLVSSSPSWNIVYTTSRSKAIVPRGPPIVFFQEFCTYHICVRRKYTQVPTMVFCAFICHRAVEPFRPNIAIFVQHAPLLFLIHPPILEWACELCTMGNPSHLLNPSPLLLPPHLHHCKSTEFPTPPPWPQLKALERIHPSSSKEDLPPIKKASNSPKPSTKWVWRWTSLMCQPSM